MTYPNDPQGRRPESWESQPTQYIPPASQSGYEQPGYQQPGHPQQAQRAGQPPVNPFGAQSNDTFGIAGTVLALLGGILGVVAITSLDWYTNGITFSKVSDSGVANGFASTYFSWFAWTALVVTVIAAVGSSFPSPAVRALRIIGVVIGVATAGLSFLAVRVDDNGVYTDYIKHARAGFYLLVIAYLLAAIGAGIGPSKVNTTAYRR